MVIYRNLPLTLVCDYVQVWILEKDVDEMTKASDKTKCFC